MKVKHSHCLTPVHKIVLKPVTPQELHFFNVTFSLIQASFVQSNSSRSLHFCTDCMSTPLIISPQNNWVLISVKISKEQSLRSVDHKTELSFGRIKENILTTVEIQPQTHARQWNNPTDHNLSKPNKMTPWLTLGPNAVINFPYSTNQQSPWPCLPCHQD